MRMDLSIFIVKPSFLRILIVSDTFVDHSSLISPWRSESSTKTTERCPFSHKTEEGTFMILVNSLTASQYPFGIPVNLTYSKFH